MGVEKSETLAVRVRQGLTADDHKEMLCGNEMSCISFVVFPYVKYINMVLKVLNQ